MRRIALAFALVSVAAPAHASEIVCFPFATAMAQLMSAKQSMGGEFDILDDERTAAFLAALNKAEPGLHAKGDAILMLATPSGTMVAVLDVMMRNLCGIDAQPESFESAAKAASGLKA